GDPGHGVGGCRRLSRPRALRHRPAGRGRRRPVPGQGQRPRPGGGSGTWREARTARRGRKPMSEAVRKAVIPAAGLGTRFLPATKAQPKEMLPLVDKPAIQYVRSEERRVGKECRSRWGPYDEKKKKEKRGESVN